LGGALARIPIRILLGINLKIMAYKIIALHGR
jgi:hypothetical protein